MSRVVKNNTDCKIFEEIITIPVEMFAIFFVVIV